MKKEQINIFFACDDNYIPFLSVTLASMFKNCEKGRFYNICILNSGLKEENIKKISAEFYSSNIEINFCDVSEELEKISNRLHTRDYYSKSTYFRLFIPSLFPNIDKALYLDCDILLKDDISRLYDTKLGNNLIGAIHDSFVDTNKALGQYVKHRIGVKAKKYFNAGVILMNLKEMRKFDFKDKFINLLSSVKFDVAQDQDYLNALCKGRVKFIEEKWNFMPLESQNVNKKISLIHFNLDYKPWQKDGIMFAQLFWEYAHKSIFAEEISNIKDNFDAKKQLKAKVQTFNLISLCLAQANDKDENKKIKDIIKAIKKEKIEYEQSYSIERETFITCEN